MSVETGDEVSNAPVGADVARDVDEAITSRRSIRAFLPTPVRRKAIEHILEVSARAPSGTNMQPWKVYVTAGTAKEELSQEILDAYWAGAEGHKRVWKYYPDAFFEPFKTRRRTVGWALYGALGIERGETEKMKAQRARNYAFFDAPVGMIFTIDERLEIGSWLDYGMFMQNVMVAARAEGLHTCPQAAFGDYHTIIRRRLGIPDNETVICGMSVGYADVDDPSNSFTTERAPLEEFVSFIGYDD
jgi:nitroreductase